LTIALLPSFLLFFFPSFLLSFFSFLPVGRRRRRRRIHRRGKVSVYISLAEKAAKGVY